MSRQSVKGAARALLFLCCLVLLPDGVCGRVSLFSSTSKGRKAPAFSLKDQYDKRQDYQFPRDRVSVLAFGDREGAGQIESWVRPLYERYGEKVDIRGVAVLSSVPSPARGIVRRIMKRQVKYPVMLDWNGEVSRNYAYRGGRAGLFVIDRQGHILLETEGAADAAALARVFAQIDRLVE